MTRKHTKRRGASAVLFALGALLLLFLLAQRGVLDGPQAFFQRMFSPVQSATLEGGEGFAARIRRFGSLWDADRRILESEARLADLESSALQMRELERENVFLREQLRLDPQQASPAVLARIIAVNPAISNTLTLDVGAESGVRLEAPVLVNGSLFGYITHVSARTSQLRLITDPKSVLKASIPEAMARGLLEGTIGQRDLLLKEVPPTVPLAVGMTVLSEGMGGTPHTPLVVGVIQELVVDAKATSLTARVAPTTRPRDVDRVLVLLNP